jgi:hypothetical protein
VKNPLEIQRETFSLASSSFTPFFLSFIPSIPFSPLNISLFFRWHKCRIRVSTRVRRKKRHTLYSVHCIIQIHIIWETAYDYVYVVIWIYVYVMSCSHAVVILLYLYMLSFCVRNCVLWRIKMHSINSFNGETRSRNICMNGVHERKKWCEERGYERNDCRWISKAFSITQNWMNRHFH